MYRRKSVVKETETKELLSFDKGNNFGSRNNNAISFQGARSKSSANYMFDHSFDATKKAN